MSGPVAPWRILLQAVALMASTWLSMPLLDLGGCLGMVAREFFHADPLLGVLIVWGTMGVVWLVNRTPLWPALSLPVLVMGFTTGLDIAVQPSGYRIFVVMVALGWLVFRLALLLRTAYLARRSP